MDCVAASQKRVHSRFPLSLVTVIGGRAGRFRGAGRLVTPSDFADETTVRGIVSTLERVFLPLSHWVGESSMIYGSK
jgi:hypothetical protein